MADDLIPIDLDSIVDEVLISDQQLFNLRKKYGAEGMAMLERQIIDKGLIIEKSDFNREMIVRRPKQPVDAPQVNTGHSQ